MAAPTATPRRDTVTRTSVFDSLGTPRDITITFEKTATVNEWGVVAYLGRRGYRDLVTRRRHAGDHHV